MVDRRIIALCRRPWINSHVLPGEIGGFPAIFVEFYPQVSGPAPLSKAKPLSWCAGLDRRLSLYRGGSGLPTQSRPSSEVTAACTLAIKSGSYGITLCQCSNCWCAGSRLGRCGQLRSGWPTRKMGDPLVARGTFHFHTSLG